MRWGAVALACVGLVAVGLCPALAVEAADESAMRAIVDRQIGAFRADDGDLAFSMATPNLRAIFGSSSGFMAMVRQGYRPVYRPRSYAFAPGRDGQSGPEVPVLIEDDAGARWTAIYSFERQPDGTWAISGCRLVKVAELGV
jgi:hypothetical protein